MFDKVLIANRGETAICIQRTCREMGIPTVALFEPSDIYSLHVRLSDECVPISPGDFYEPQTLVHIAQEKNADAIHPGYGFIAERFDFAQACQKAGITFIGPPPEALEPFQCRMAALDRAQQAGFPTVEHSPLTFDSADPDHGCSIAEMKSEALQLGYPVILKHCSNGRGIADRQIRDAPALEEALLRSRSESRVKGVDPHLYLEKAFLPSYQVGVIVLCDHKGNQIQLGDVESFTRAGGQRILIESPAPCLKNNQHQQIQQTALELARLFGFQGCGTLEFLVDQAGYFVFREMKTYLPFEHPLVEMITGIDLVRKQISIAAGEPLTLQQEELQPHGSAMLSCIKGRIPPTNGSHNGHGEFLQHSVLPNGPHVRVDTHIYSGYQPSSEYDTLLAKIAVWGEDRGICLRRMQRSIQEVKLAGISTNLNQLQAILSSPEYVGGMYINQPAFAEKDTAEYQASLQRLAAAAAVLYTRRNQPIQMELPDRLVTGWRQNNRTMAQWLYSGLTYEQIGRQDR